MALRPVSLSSCVTYVSARDPSIDWSQIEALELEKFPELLRGDVTPDVRAQATQAHFATRYAEETLKNPGCWRDLLKFKSGESPTIFTIGVIDPDEMCRLADDCKIGSESARVQELKWRAFLASVRDISTFGQEQPQKRGERVDAQWLKEHCGRGMRLVALDVGMVAWRWNQLTEDEAKN